MEDHIRRFLDDGHARRIATDARARAAGEMAAPVNDWATVRVGVSDTVWERILSDLAPRSRAEAEAAARRVGLP